VQFPRPAGHRSRSPDWMRRSRAFLQHSLTGTRRRPAGLTGAVMEAQLSGLPVVGNAPLRDSGGGAGGGNGPFW